MMLPSFFGRIDRREDGSIKLPFAGSLGIYSKRSELNKLLIEWQFPSEFTHLYLKQEWERFTIGIANPLLALWLAFPPLCKRFEDKDIFTFSFHDSTLYWRFFATRHCWSSKTPKWKDGYFNFANFFLGKLQHSSKCLREMEVEVPLPEKSYKGQAQLFLEKWKRPRWFGQRVKRVSIKLNEGEQIPIPGKGENSWDCGDDARFATTVPANTIEEGVGKFVGNILQTRMNRMGKHRWKKK